MRKPYSYLIWLMPYGKVNGRLSKIINELSKKYNSPRFAPHVTLLGSFEGFENELFIKAKNLSNIIKPFEVELTKASYLNEFFRSLFILVKKDRRLVKNHESGRKLFNISENKKFMPHLSLIYGNFNVKTKKEMIKLIGKNFNLKFKAKSIYLVHKNEVDLKWTVIQKFDLKN